MPFIRYCCLILILLVSCNERNSSSIVQLPQLYSAPLSYALKLNNGYVVNPLTNDSIQPLLTKKGDAFLSGVPIKMIFEKKNADSVGISRTLSSIKLQTTILHNRVRLFPTSPQKISIDTSFFDKIKWSQRSTFPSAKTVHGVMPTGVSIPVTGKEMPYQEPIPMKAAAMRLKDNASTTIRYLDVDQGLSFPYLYDVLEDHIGNIWIGMDGTGLCKYNGNDFTVYSNQQGLSNGIVTSIAEDHNHNLWVGTHQGLNKFDGNHFVQYSVKNGLPGNWINSLLVDKNNNLWICSSGGLTKYDGVNMTTFSKKEGLPADFVHMCYEDKKGNLWIATTEGVALFDGTTFTHYTQKNGLLGKDIVSIAEDKKGNLWFASVKNGITLFDGKTFTYLINQEVLIDNYLYKIKNDRKGNIWIYTWGNGIDLFDGKKFTHYGTEQGLTNNKVRGLCEDRTGNIWLATEGGGINKISVNAFNYLITKEALNNNRVRPIIASRNGDLWMGTDAGYFGKLIKKNKVGDYIFTYYQVSDKQFFPGQRALLEDSKGRIWIGTTGSGLVQYDGKIFKQYFLGSTPERETVFDIKEDKKGSIWVTTLDGSIIRYNGNEWELCSTCSKLPGNFVYSIFKDSKDNLWFCSDGAGVYKYDGEHLIHYSEKEGLFAKNITSAIEDSEGNLWFGTLGVGVCRFDGTTFTYYTEHQGLANNNVWSVFYDHFNQLWFGTDKGLTLCTKQIDLNNPNNQTYHLHNFNSANGLKAVDFNLRSVAIDHNQQIWWGTGNNVPSFSMTTAFKTDSLCSLHLNYIEINDQFVDFRNRSDSLKNKITFSTVVPYSNYPENLILNYNYNHLSFHFTAIDWSAPEKIQYSYRLLGLDTNWSKPSPTGVADYRNLSYGKYELQIIAIGQSQNWTKPFKYRFTILPTWWQTWWFKLIVVLLTFAITIGIVRQVYLGRLRKQKTQMEKQLAVQLERQRISAEMHDDIGAGLSGVKLLTEITKNKLKEKDLMEDIDKIYHSVGDISSKMKEVIWSLNSENDSLSSLIAYLQTQAKYMMEHYQGTLIINIPEIIPDLNISGEVRRHIYLSVKEALHNIIKHSRADKIDMTIKFKTDLQIQIVDNGVGFNFADSNYTGNGLKNMQKRMKEIKGELIIKNNPGLALTFIIPINSAI